MNHSQPPSDTTPLEGALLRLVDVHKRYRVKDANQKKVDLHAVQGVSLAVYRGETVGLVGESGCGKSTLGRMAVGLEPPTDGEIWLGDTNIAAKKAHELRQVRSQIQVVFQDPSGSLNPRMTVGATVAEPLRNFGIVKPSEIEGRCDDLFERVGLPVQLKDSYPHQLSGGQQQRVAIARALAPEPEILVLDEPTSALDVSVQAKIINLLRKLSRQSKLTSIFISHDLSVTALLSERVVVMYLGVIVETGPTSEVYSNPRHPYTAALLSASPGMAKDDTDGLILTGDIPSAIDEIQGCKVAGRCPFTTERCLHEEQHLEDVGHAHQAACWRANTGEIDLSDFAYRVSDGEKHWHQTDMNISE